jgi:drug/metabolite transporter (DMT)-like permease
MDPLLLAASRLLIAGVLLLPLYFREAAREAARRSQPGASIAFHFAAFRTAAAGGAVIALHFISWIIGARATSAANSTLIVNMVPIAMPFVAVALNRVVPTKRELAATAIALCGVLIMGLGDFSLAPEYFIGDVVCFVSMLLFTVYLALSRRLASDGRLWTYIVPLYLIGGFIALAAAAAMNGSLAPPSPADALLAFGLALGPTVIGHSILNWAMTVLRPQSVSIANLFQFVSATILAFLIFGEKPHPLFYLTTVFIICGALLAITEQARKK